MNVNIYIQEVPFSVPRFTGKTAEIPERPKNNSETLIGDHY